MASDVVRRSVDILLSLGALLVLGPLFLLIAIAVKSDSSGPVFYLAQRTGRNGQLFRLFKFRSMVTGADRHGPGVTISGDSRVTRMGRFLRRTKLDELPQLWNVLRGDMSLVGPRPEDPRYVALYTAQQRRVLSVRPGITSAASLAFRHEEQLLTGPNWEEKYRTEVLPAKLAIDLDYLDRRTLVSDFGLIFKTFLALFQ